MWSTLLILLGVHSHHRCETNLVCITHYSFYSVTSFCYFTHNTRPGTDLNACTVHMLAIKGGTLHERLYSRPTHDWVKVRSSGHGWIGRVVKVGIGDSLEMVKGSPGDRWAWLMLDSQGSRPDFGAVKGSSTKIWWVKILTAVAGGSTGDYAVSPPCAMVHMCTLLSYTNLNCVMRTLDLPWFDLSMVCKADTQSAFQMHA